MFGSPSAPDSDSKCSHVFAALNRQAALGLDTADAKGMYTALAQSLECDSYMSEKFRKTRDAVAREITCGRPRNREEDGSNRVYGFSRFMNPFLFAELEYHSRS